MFIHPYRKTLHAPAPKTWNGLRGIKLEVAFILLRQKDFITVANKNNN